MAVHDQNNAQPQQPAAQQQMTPPPMQAAQPQATGFNFAGHQPGDFNLDDLIGGGISPLAYIS